MISIATVLLSFMFVDLGSRIEVFFWINSSGWTGRIPAVSPKAETAGIYTAPFQRLCGNIENLDPC